MDARGEPPFFLATFQPWPIRSRAEASRATALVDGLNDLHELSEGQREFVDRNSRLDHRESPGR